MPLRTYSFGASVRGPLHRRAGTPNEDAWLRAEGRFGKLIVVCDGMGSKPNARAGAHAACVAVKEAVTRWAKVDGAPPSLLTHLIEVLWRLRLHPMDPTSAATTCLFALATTKGTWIIGGVGDGIALVRSASDLRVVVGDRIVNFSNETNGLGASKGPKAWTLIELPPTDNERIAVVATDGVADDLLPERLDGLCDWLISTFEHKKPAERWRGLTDELQNWPTPRHLDDKTIAVLHASASTSKETK